MPDVQVTPEAQRKAEQMALLIMGAVIEMSDRAEALGGATSIAGIASLHALQKSLQRNRARILSALGKGATVG